MASDEREKLMNTVKSIMRSILISCKEGIPAHRIEHEYRDLAEEPIPFEKLGFKRIQDFIKAIPDVVRISSNRDGGAQLFPVANEETAHILKMVKAQRSKKVRSKKPVRGPIRRPYNQKPGPRPYQHRYPARPPSNYMHGSGRPAPRPQGRPTAPHGRSFSRLQYNTGTPYRPQQSFNSYSYGSTNGPSRLPERGFGPMSSGSSYQNFTVTVPDRRKGSGVELSYGFADDDFADSTHPKLASVVVKPPTFNQVRATKPDVIKYGDKFEVPPRFKGRLEMNSSGKLPKANHREPSFQPRPPLLPDPVYGSWDSSRVGRENKPRPLPELKLPVCIERGPLYKKLIADYCRRNKLPEPVYDTMSLNHGFLSSLVVDGQNYGSLEPFQNKEAAEDAAARTACRTLDIEKGPQGKTEPAPEINNDPKVKERIREILISKPNGIWFTRLPVEYKEKYKTEAPSNLLQLLQSWSDFVKLESNTHVNTYIVYFAKPDVEIPMASLFPLQQKVAVWMSYLSEDGQFYVQRSNNEIDSLTEEVQSLSQLSSRIPGPELKQGLFCVAKYEADNSWCRAQVLQYTPGTDVVDVLFLDYGNEEQVPLEAVRRLSDRLAQTPAQAVKCMLHGVSPLEGDLWHGEAIDDFEAMVRNIELQALTKSHNGDMCLVELFSSTESEMSINASMVSKGLLTPTVPEYQALMPSSEPTNQASKEAETSIHGPGEPEPLTFPEEQYWNIYISFLSSINNITFRLVGENYSDKLEELEQDLEQGFASFPPPGADLAVGTVGVAQVDGLYHRVRVLEVHSDSTVKCYFLDHGDSDDLNLSQLKLIPLELNTLPYQACHCGVAGMDTSNETVMAQALEKLTHYTLGKTCVAEVVSSYGRHHSVILYDTSGDEDVNINDLVTQEIASENHQAIPADDSDQLSVTSETSTTSSTGRPAQVTIKPKFLQLQSSRDTTANTDTESISSECSSTSERPVQLKPKFLSRSHSSSQSPETTADMHSTTDSHIAGLNSAFDADLKLDAASVSSDLRLSNSDLGITSSDLGIASSDFGLLCSDIGMLGSDSGIACPDLQLAISSLRLQDSEQQPNSIEPAMLEEFAQGVSSQSIIGTSLSYKVRDVSPHNNSASSTEGRYSINPEDIPLPETCSELSSLSDVDFGNFDPKAVDYGYKKAQFPDETTPTPDSKNQIIYDFKAQGDGPHIQSVDIWSKDYLNLPLPPYFQPPASGEFIDVHVRWVSDPENFVCLPYDSLQEYAVFMSELGKYLDETPKVRDLQMDEIKVGHLYAGKQGDTWYRAVVKDFLQDSKLACILLADIGEFDVISVDELRPLPTRFWTMPFQAFRAKLYGAATLDNKAWSEASKYKCMELVLNKDLVGLVRDKDPVTGVVSLELVDTSDEVQDVHINDVFTCHLISWMDY